MIVISAQNYIKKVLHPFDPQKLSSDVTPKYQWNIYDI